MRLDLARFSAPPAPADPSVAATRAGAQALQRLADWPGEHRVVVGLSGGVDSSLTAALLVEAGWQVEGLTLWLMSGKGACCAEGLVDAAGICEQLKVPHHVVDFREHFKAQIVDFLVEGYGAGVTPLPCSRCNREVKFGPMLQWAEQERGIGRLATGHYARIRHGEVSENGRHQLLRGLDARKGSCRPGRHPPCRLTGVVQDPGVGNQGPGEAQSVEVAPAYPPGTEGGPRWTGLRRLPARRSLYAVEMSHFTDKVDPWMLATAIANPNPDFRAFVAPLFVAMAIDNRSLLREAWACIAAHPEYPQDGGVLLASEATDPNLRAMLSEFDALPRLPGPAGKGCGATARRSVLTSFPA